MAELGRVPGQRGKALEKRRVGERRGCCSCGFGAGLCTPLLPPHSISSLAPPGTHALARPQEPGSQDQAKGERRGNKRGKEGYHKRKRKTELT